MARRCLCQPYAIHLCWVQGIERNGFSETTWASAYPWCIYRDAWELCTQGEDGKPSFWGESQKQREWDLVGWGPGNTGSHCCTAWLDPVLSYWVLHSRADSQEKYVPTKTASTLRCLLCPLDFSYLVNVKGHVAGDAQQMQKVTSVQAFNKTKASYF